MKVLALVFDACGTLFNVHSGIALCERLCRKKGAVLSQLWGAKQLEYTWLKSLVGRYEDFSRITAMMKNFGLAQHFEAVLSVDAAKVFKPDPRVYHLAVDHLGLNKTAIGFVSPNYWDVAGAKAFGCNAFLNDRD